MKSPTVIPLTPKTIPLTQKALEAKQAELAALTQQRAEIIVRLQTAREMGDLSENGAYHAAKFELGNVGRQLRQVNHVLNNAYVPKPVNKNAVGFGRTITLSNGSKKLTFMLVSQYESDPKEKKLSLESPIGQAVIGKKIGDEIEVATPSGKILYTLIEIN